MSRHRCPQRALKHEFPTAAAIETVADGSGEPAGARRRVRHCWRGMKLLDVQTILPPFPVRSTSRAIRTMEVNANLTRLLALSEHGGGLTAPTRLAERALPPAQCLKINSRRKLKSTRWAGVRRRPWSAVAAVGVASLPLVDVGQRAGAAPYGCPLRMGPAAAVAARWLRLVPADLGIRPQG
jgi:hypothetical protein